MKILYALIFVSLLLPACTDKLPVYEKDGKQYGITPGLFSGRWWSYYERGLSFSEGEFYHEAANDFQHAVKLRRDDKWRARTYGMHFVDYFPHRELGIVYYRMQRYFDAVRELENSLRTADSAKAKYFLNLARRAILDQTGRDISSPELSITHPPPKSVTNRLSMDIEGIATDDTFVSIIMINESPLFLELAKPRIDFHQTAILKEGENAIRVYAEDLSGKSVEKVVQVTVDRRGPLIGVSRIETRGTKKLLKFFVMDNTEIAALSVNNRRIALKEATEEVELTEEVEKGPVVIQARDVAGNLTVAEIPINEDNYSTHSLPRLAALEFGSFAIDYGGEELSGKESLGRLRFAAISDTEAPVLTLKDDEPVRELYDDSLLLEGNVSDTSTIVSIKVNGEEILARKGRKVFFTILKPLRIGENTFNIEATDSFGNSRIHKIVVKRKVAKVKQIGARLGLGILPLDQKGEKTLISEGVYDKLISAFLHQQRFNVVERHKLEAILQELKMSDTVLVDPESAVKIGRIMAVDYMLIGSVLAMEKSLEVVTRLVDTETSVVLASHDVFSETVTLRSVNDLLEALAFKYKRDFPLIEGIIIEIKPDDVILIDLGAKDKIKEHTKVICFREVSQIQHPVSGKVLGVEPLELGLAKVKKAYEEFSHAEVIRLYQDLQVMDRVITK